MSYIHKKIGCTRTHDVYIVMMILQPKKLPPHCIITQNEAFFWCGSFPSICIPSNYRLSFFFKHCCCCWYSFFFFESLHHQEHKNLQEPFQIVLNVKRTWILFLLFLYAIIVDIYTYIHTLEENTYIETKKYERTFPWLWKCQIYYGLVRNAFNLRFFLKNISEEFILWGFFHQHHRLVLFSF